MRPAHGDLLHAALAYLGGVAGEHGGEGVAAGAGQQGAEGVWNMKIGEEARPCGWRGGFGSTDEIPEEPTGRSAAYLNKISRKTQPRAEFVTIHMLRPAHCALRDFTAAAAR